MTLRDKLFSFHGRLRRSDWWIWGIVVNLAWFALGSLTDILTSGAVNGRTPMAAESTMAVAAGLAVSAVTFWPVLALYAKRVHDLNWPAWPLFAMMIALEASSWIPYDLMPAFSAEAATGPEIALTALSCAFGLAWAVVVFMLAFIDGAPGPNRFGPSPKALSDGRPAFVAPGGLE